MSNNPAQQLDSCRHLNKLLSIVEVFSTPLERRSIAEVLMLAWQNMEQHKIVPRLSVMLRETRSPPLLCEVLKILTLYMAGPRIASLPEEHILHPSKMLFKKAVKSYDVVPQLVHLLSHSEADVRETAIVAIGSYVAFNWECRDDVLNYCYSHPQVNNLQPFINLLAPDQRLSTLQKASFTVSCLCGATHSPKHLPNFKQIIPCLNPLAILLHQVTDEIVLRNICDCFSLILPGIPNPSVCHRLISLLECEDLPEAVRSSLSVLIEIAKYDDTQTRVHTKKIFFPNIFGAKNFFILDIKDVDQWEHHCAAQDSAQVKE